MNNFLNQSEPTIQDSIFESYKTKLVLLFSASLSMGMGVTWFRVAAFAQCLDHFDSKTVTYSIAVAMTLLPLVGFVHARLTASWSIRKIVVLNFVALASTIFMLCFIGKICSAGSVSTFYVFFFPFLSTFTFVPFWQLVSRFFRGENGCRACLMITIGFPIAQILAGSSSSWISDRFGSLGTMLLAALAMIVSGLSIIEFIRRFGQHGRSEEPSTYIEANKTKAPRSLAKPKYIGFLIFSMSVLVTMCAALTNHLFQHSAEDFFTSHSDLAAGLGTIEMVTGALELGIMFFLSARIIKSCGVLPGLVVFPAIILVSVLVMFCQTGSNVGVVFFAAAASLIVNQVMRPAPYKPSIKLLVDLGNAKQQMQMVAKIETISKPIAAAIAGIVVFLASSVFALSVLWIIGILVACCTVWIVVGLTADHIYRSQKTTSDDEQKSVLNLLELLQSVPRRVANEMTLALVFAGQTMADLANLVIRNVLGGRQPTSQSNPTSVPTLSFKSMSLVAANAAAPPSMSMY